MSIINRIVFTFPVPVFYLITGCFVKEECLIPFAKKKAQTLLVPYVVACIVIVIVSGIISTFSETDALVTIAVMPVSFSTSRIR